MIKNENYIKEFQLKWKAIGISVSTEEVYNAFAKFTKDKRRGMRRIPVNGTPPDEGVMVELGIAIALKKKIFLFRDDFRKCTDSEDYPLNLMIFAGSGPGQIWKNSFYTNINQITDESMDLALWCK